MYDKILVTVDGTPTDRAIIEHVKELAVLARRFTSPTIRCRTRRC